jgi:hypothetical protein
VVVPADALIVRLDLDLAEGEDRSSYSVSLSLSGDVVWREEPLRKETREGAAMVSVWIPAHVLHTGSYTVALESGGSPVGYYSLAIQRDQSAP